MSLEAKNVCTKPLNLIDRIKKKAENHEVIVVCLRCDQEFNVQDIDSQKNYLSHLLKEHRMVISDVDHIGHFQKYNQYWKERFSQRNIDDFCFKINTNSAQDDKGDVESFFLLCDDLPEDKTLREKLNIFKLEKALAQQESERNDKNYFRDCLFCGQQIGNNRLNILQHLSESHNFTVGNADNLVYFDEFYQKLNQRIALNKCLFCEKIFYNKQTMKEHMRKKQHKSINPNNREFDKFYIINYLEYSKYWQEIKHERDTEENRIHNQERNPSLEDWNDPVQTYCCLFCDESFEDETEIVDHMNLGHKFDLKSTQFLSFYNQIKLINYIRRQVFLKNCFICSQKFDSNEELLKHLEADDHIKEFPNMDLWDQPEYYFSTFEDDNLLCLLDDNGYNKDESKIKVIPEDIRIEIRKELLESLKDLDIN
ncbi:zinc finger protein 277-like [Brachionus plicatilis]|uniref:Zinc finger protein 277-like n=1 Tax=Brachionus plicatilis TaxID=10195 RepID=A0A3M7S7K9_BRAPC|nr:zinc finger protein 277-like [Brachionus plicatilis]